MAPGPLYIFERFGHRAYRFDRRVIYSRRAAAELPVRVW
ncbi:MAG: hypothetical protein JWR37_327 [Mycobacterium sp.]|nr:hypothetical protein [Mycobacterium sp.]